MSDEIKPRIDECGVPRCAAKDCPSFSDETKSPTLVNGHCRITRWWVTPGHLCIPRIQEAERDKEALDAIRAGLVTDWARDSLGGYYGMWIGSDGRCHTGRTLSDLRDAILAAAEQVKKERAYADSQRT